MKKESICQEKLYKERSLLELDRHYLRPIKYAKNSLFESINLIDDVTVIDKVARLLFPMAFILFNSFYWIFYNFFKDYESEI